MQKVLSIVIPTHNRYRYAKFSLLSILELNLDIELVISDTSDDYELGEFIDNLDLSKYPSSKLIYHYNKRAYDMTGNHNKALSLATGEFVCLIGDDDSVSAFVLDACAWMNKNNVNVLSQLTSANYIWPDFKTKFFGDAHAGRLYIDKTLSKLDKLDSKVAFNQAMARSAQGTDGLPKLYHGIVRRSLLQEIHNNSGKFVHGSSPDFSAAIALAAITDSFYQTTFPITIPGASGGSNTGRSALNKHKGSLESESQTKNDKGSWEKEIPPFFSVETVWADACFKSLDSMAVSYKEKFDFIGFYALLLVNHPDYKDVVLKSFNSYFNEKGFNSCKAYSLLFFNTTKILISKIFRILIRLLNPSPSKGKFFFSNLVTVQFAPAKLSEYINSKKIRNIFR